MYIFPNWRKITYFFEDLSVGRKKNSLAFIFFQMLFFSSSFISFLTTYSSNKHRRNTISTLVLECRKHKHLYEILPPPIFFKVFNCDGIVAFHKLNIYLKVKIC